MDSIKEKIQLSLVIPCYNEADRIGLLYNGINSFIEKWHSILEVIIINDGSKDNTETLLKEHEVYKKYNNLISIYTQENTGKGGALKNGIQKATGNFILTLDADMATSPDEVFNWLNFYNGTLPDNTILIGSREHKESIIANKGNRKFAGNVFNLIVRIISPLNLKDTQCGFKLYPAYEAKKIFDTLQTFGWAHDVEILYKAKIDKVTIIEMPISWTAVDGSKIKLFQDGIKMLIEILIIVLKTKLQYPPKTNNNNGK